MRFFLKRHLQRSTGKHVRSETKRDSSNFDEFLKNEHREAKSSAP